MLYHFIAILGFSISSACDVEWTSGVWFLEGWDHRPSDQIFWAVLHPACGGQQQSPVAIATEEAIPISVPALKFNGYQKLLPEPLMTANVGYTVALSFPKYSPEEEKKGLHLPYITGGPLDGKYEIEGLHFHWGGKDNRGSEHILDDMPRSLEMHIIHQNEKYKTLEEALQHPDGLCVLAFFYQVVKTEAKLLTPLFENMSAIKNFNTSMHLPRTFSLSSMFSGLDTENFYTYKGSLTTPPCSEAVTWIIFPDPLPISIVQMNNLRGLLSKRNVSLVDNFRQPQPLFGRKVFVRNTSKNPNSKKTTPFPTKWDWNDKK